MPTPTRRLRQDGGVAGLSRRAFLATVGALSTAWALPKAALGQALAAPIPVADQPSTLLQTIGYGPVQRGAYRTLVARPGEPYAVRVDLTRAAPNPAREGARRSILYIGHFSDLHLMDAQSPARLEPMIVQSHATWAGAFRPQDTLTTYVAAQMVQSIADLRISPVTGAPMSAAFVTGDTADMLSNLETRWYVDLMDGVPITPNSGAAGVYEGVQAWAEAFYAYHPEDPTGDWFGDYGFPAVPGMLTAAVTQQPASPGLPVPWYGVYGNHDTTFLGTLAVPDSLKALAIGDRKAWDWIPLSIDYVQGWAAETSAFRRLLDQVTTNLGVRSGFKAVTSDPARKLLEAQEFMQAHFQTTPNPGPVGHGFTQANLDTGTTYWSADIGPHARAFGLDTCNQVAGPDGAVPQDQFDWLEAGLQQCQAEGRLALVFSHHNSTTLENTAELAFSPGQRLIHAEEFIAMLLKYPACVAWVNGHTHINTILAHSRGDGTGGLWEITAASCIDFPQQQQVLEFVDNRDGTMSIFTTIVDHASAPAWSPGDLSPVGLASLSRELSANDWIEDPAMRLGSVMDRNCELLLPAPFDLSAIDDAALEAARANDRARLLAWEQGWPA
jgi:metallophosphoesterase (TIGR03767 family)